MDKEVREGVESVLDDHEFLSWLGVELDTIKEGWVEMSVPYDEKLTNAIEGSYGAIHGGVTATLVDTASGFALRTTFADPLSPALTTTDLDVTYLRPARSDLRVEANVVKAGGSMGFTEVTVYGIDDGTEKVVATGTTTYRLFRDRIENE